jgi:hypothetical protein
MKPQFLELNYSLSSTHHQTIYINPEKIHHMVRTDNLHTEIFTGKGEYDCVSVDETPERIFERIDYLYRGK